ncbi:hypothetical protein LEMLEM_LOCUS7966 [Lemmus lemmus]
MQLSLMLRKGPHWKRSPSGTLQHLLSSFPTWDSGTNRVLCEDLLPAPQCRTLSQINLQHHAFLLAAMKIMDSEL